MVRVDDGQVFMRTCRCQRAGSEATDNITFSYSFICSDAIWHLVCWLFAFIIVLWATVIYGQQNQFCWGTTTLSRQVLTMATSFFPIRVMLSGTLGERASSRTGGADEICNILSLQDAIAKAFFTHSFAASIARCEFHIWRSTRIQQMLPPSAILRIGQSAFPSAISTCHWKVLCCNAFRSKSRIYSRHWILVMRR